MLHKQFISVIISAAGAGSRMGTDGKMHLAIAGEAVLSRTLRTFSAIPWIDELVVVVRPKDEAGVSALLSRMAFSCPVQLVHGGAERHDSVMNGLKALSQKSAIVLTHDGARPFVREEDIRKVAEAVVTRPAAAVAIPMTDTVKVVREDRTVVTTPDRSTLWRVQTPQGFQTAVLKNAYETASREGIIGTDDCSIVEKLGIPVQLIPGSDTNIKITTQSDLCFGEAIVREEQK